MTKTYIDKAKQLLRIESEAIADLEGRIGKNFEKAVRIILRNKGKVVVTGIGKSGLIGQKIAATLSSTGNPSFFVHAGEASHGDIGGISRNDVLLIISNSGETEEIVYLLPYVKKLRVPIIGMLGKPNSTLAKSCDAILDIQVKEEACPLGLVPTSSSIVTSAMGDALAIALLQKRGFRKQDFAGLHPGGILGRKLLTTVSDLMHIDNFIPLSHENKTMKDVLFVMTAKKLGVVGILDNEDNLVGAITDGDLRRGLEKTNDFLNRSAKDIMTTNPKWVKANTLAIDALKLMERYEITNIFVYNGEKIGKPTGIIHIHDILSFGIML